MVLRTSPTIVARKFIGSRLCRGKPGTRSDMPPWNGGPVYSHSGRPTRTGFLHGVVSPEWGFTRQCPPLRYGPQPTSLLGTVCVLTRESILKTIDPLGTARSSTAMKFESGEGSSTRQCPPLRHGPHVPLQRLFRVCRRGVCTCRRGRKGLERPSLSHRREIRVSLFLSAGKEERRSYLEVAEREGGGIERDARSILFFTSGNVQTII